MSFVPFREVRIVRNNPPIVEPYPFDLDLTFFAIDSFTSSINWITARWMPRFVCEVERMDSDYGGGCL